MNGVLVLHKPRGITSFGVVRDVRRALGVKRVGHTGTLDPMAEGVLPLCLGAATGIAQFISEGDKSYEATVRLGVTTDTLDAEGAEIARLPVPSLGAAAIELVLAKFRGKQHQVPPMYSAVKVGGKRLYELARSGVQVERTAREVTVSRLTLQAFRPEVAELDLTITSSKGFFVRTLAADIGEAFGCGAHLTALLRTRCGPYSLADAHSLHQVLREGADGARSHLLAMDDALHVLPHLTVSSDEAGRVRHGGRVASSRDDGGPCRVLDEAGTLLAIADVKAGQLVYRRVLAQLW